MNDKEKILKTVSDLIEAGILTANDVKKEFVTNLKFKKDNIINQMDLVSRDEFEVLKKIVKDQEIKINKLIKSKKVKKP